MKKRFLLAFCILVVMVAIVGRLLPHPPNFAPVGALALFAGLYFAKTTKWALFLPLAAMFLSDLAIGFYDAKLMVVVYGSFLLYGFFGFLARDQKSFARKIATTCLATLAGSFLFYLVTNFAVWAFSSWYPADFSGLLLSYYMGLPFLKYTLLGDFFFVGVFVGGFEFAKAFLPQTRQREVVA